MNRGITQIIITMVLFAIATAIQAEPPRTLLPVADPLEQLHGELKEARDQSAEDLSQARKALQIAAPKLSERLENLAEAAKRLEKETNEVAESVTKDEKSKTEEVQDLLNQQEKLHMAKPKRNHFQNGGIELENILK